MDRFFLAVTLLLATNVDVSSAQPQMPDTTAAWRYYPLSIGNIWEYQGHGMDPGDHRAWIESDTVFAGKHYFVEVTETMPVPAGSGPIYRHKSLIRFDSTSAHLIVRWPDGSEHVAQPPGCPLDAPFGGSVLCPGWGEALVQGGHGRFFRFLNGNTLDGVTIKKFDTGYGGGWNYIAGIGYAGSELGLEPGGTRLAYARIDGVEYGSPLPLSAEEFAGLGESLELKAFPNPTKNDVSVTVRMVRGGSIHLAIYDLLGREFSRLHEDRRAPGTHTFTIGASYLTPGVYMIRAVVEPEMAQTLIVVVQ